MELSEFISRNLGKKIDYDNYAGAQCVDLARQVWKDVYGIPERLESCTTSGGAKDLYLDYDKMPKEKKYLSKIPKNRTFLQGDTLVWDSNPNNKYGHVAIFICKVNDKLLVLEQNGFSQKGCEITVRTKDNLLGGLRKK